MCANHVAIKHHLPLLQPVNTQSRKTGFLQKTTHAFSGLLIVSLLWLTTPVVAGELEVYPEVGPTPPLVLKDLGSNAHTLEDYRGQVVLVNFWATWCTPCLIEMPAMQRLEAAFPDTAFTVLAVNVKESREKAWRFQQLLKVHFTVLLDKTGATAEEWNVAVYPTSYLVDKTGRIRFVAYGALAWDSDEIKQVIDELVNESSQQPPAAIRAGDGASTGQPVSIVP
jgi:thiol-disulfide isomerase/thioredoxin